VAILARAAVPADRERIMEIYNQAVLATTATFDTRPRTLAEQQEWWERHGGRHPVLVAEADGTVAGWASLSPYSDRAAYDRTVELSVYIDEEWRGRGAGRLLVGEIIGLARPLGHHVVLSRITAGNAASVHLHEVFGFFRVGTLREVGEKFGRLLDVEIWQLIL
jgi:phosphinothricin acetyltransferase